MSDKNQLLRRLPNLGALLERPELALDLQRFGHHALLLALRETSEMARRQILRESKHAEELLDESNFIAAVRDCLAESTRERQVPVINGTGVILHTSLGRAVLPPEAWEFAARVARSYSMLELDQRSGKRGDRDQHVLELLCQLTGAEAATVVNNNAAATMLILNELCGGGKEAVISRAQMVEIGGSYRMMDVMRLSGAKMTEVGATNKCRAADYVEAVHPESGCIIKVHTSNYAIEGFTHFASIEELVAIGQEVKVPVVFDLGAGSLVDLAPFGLADEPVVPALIEIGTDLVCFSGDKLLGGPQAGIIVGSKVLIDRLKKNQMFRMLRCDKITLALLEGTLRLYLDPERVWRRVPTLYKISQPLEDVFARAQRLADSLATITEVEIVAHDCFVGGGSLPTKKVASHAIRVESALSADELAKRLRLGTPSVFGRIEDGHFLIDARTLADDEIPAVALAVKEALEDDQ